MTNHTTSTSQSGRWGSWFKTGLTVANVVALGMLLVSAIALAINWRKDVTSRNEARADSVRAAVARSIVALDRWRSLQLSLYQDLQPAFIDCGDIVIERGNVKARDYLWKEIGSRRAILAATIREEKLMTEYVELLAYFPPLKERFVQIVDKLQELEEETLGSLPITLQKNVLAFGEKGGSTSPTQLTNELRAIASKHREKIREGSKKLIQPLRNCLVSVLTTANDNIVSAEKRSEAVTVKECR